MRWCFGAGLLAADGSASVEAWAGRGLIEGSGVTAGAIAVGAGALVAGAAAGSGCVTGWAATAAGWDGAG